METLFGNIVFYTLLGLFSSYSFLLFTRLASKIFKPKSKPNLQNYDLGQLKNKYKTASTLALTSFFWLTPILVFLIAKISYTFGQIYLEKYRAESIYLIPYTLWAHIVPAIFLALLLWGLSIDLILDLYRHIKKVSNEEWAVYLYQLNKDSSGGHEIDYKIPSIIITAFVLIISLPAFFLAMNTYTRVTTKAIFINNYFELTEKSYQYSDVRKILFINTFKNKQSGNIEPTSSYYKVIFNNGDTWNTLNLTINKDPLEKEIIKYISSKSGRVITPGVHNIDDI